MYVSNTIHTIIRTHSDLGVHVDGYVALVAKTVVVGGTKPVTGRAADAIMACKTASEVILRMLQPGINPKLNPNKPTL
jgi:methionine aminopeptidase